ncbi:hypothetical protein [Heyndrickxia acidiproducens]|jgi:hypothetical protein|nr:hypothetical protein [Heyndrickxia acidiproducens]
MKRRMFNFIIDGRLITVKAASVKEAEMNAQEIAYNLKQEENMGSQSAV